MSVNPKIKVLQSYVHPQRGVIIIHFELDDGYRSNVNIPPDQLRGLSESEAEESIKRTLNNIYEERKRKTAEQEQAIKNVAKKLEGLEIK